MSIPFDALENLKSLAASECAHENIDEDDSPFNPFEQFGGNYDNTYAAGVRSGRIELAREILNDLGIAW